MTNIFKNIGDTKQAAAQWGISQDAIKHMCQKGTINAKKFGNSWAVDLTQPNPSYSKGDNKMAVTGIKKAVGEFNSFQGGINIYLDVEKAMVYTAESSNWVDKVNNDILIASKYHMVDRDNVTTMAKVKKLIEDALK